MTRLKRLQVVDGAQFMLMSLAGDRAGEGLGFDCLDGEIAANVTDTWKFQHAAYKQPF